jgi:hypothetical protein
MGSLSKRFVCLFICFIFLFPISAIYTSTVTAEGSKPVNSFFVLLPGMEGIDFTAYDGVPFKIFAFAYDAEGNQTTNTNGNIFLSVQNGTITPSTFGPAHEGLYAPMVTITGTNLAIITVSDSQGHTGKSIAIHLVSPTTSSPSPSPIPSPTPSVPEFSWLIILPLFFSILSIAVLTRKRKVSLIK